MKLKSSFYRVNFDLHRAAGLWLWAMLLVYAWSSVFFNLPNFYTRATQLVLDYEQPVWAREATPQNDARTPMEWEEAQATGERLMAEQARQYGFTIERPLALYNLRDKGLYEYRVRSSRDIGDKAGSTSILFDAHSGRTEDSQPADGSSQRRDPNHLARRIAHGQSLRPSLPHFRLRDGPRHRDALRDRRLHLVEEAFGAQIWRCGAKQGV